MTLEFHQYPADTNKPLVSISPLPEDQEPKNHLFVRQDTNFRDDGNTVQFQRIVRNSTNEVNPKCLRALTVVRPGVNSSIEWAVSGELTTHATEGRNDATAVSGVANKQGTVGVFGGHFQAKDWNIFATDTAVTSLVGVEINNPSVGKDHPSTYGRRWNLDLIARTNRQVAGWDTAAGNSGEGETGVGLMVRTDNFTKGYYRYGVVVDDRSQVNNPNPIGTGIRVNTSGDYGVKVSGDENNEAAIGMDAGGKFELGKDNGVSVYVRFNPVSRNIQFMRGDQEVFSVGMDGTTQGPSDPPTDPPPSDPTVIGS